MAAQHFAACSMLAHAWPACTMRLAAALQASCRLAWLLHLCLLRLPPAPPSSLHLGILMENMRREGYEFEVRGAPACCATSGAWLQRLALRWVDCPGPLLKQLPPQHLRPHCFCFPSSPIPSPHTLPQPRQPRPPSRWAPPRSSPSVTRSPATGWSRWRRRWWRCEGGSVMRGIACSTGPIPQHICSSCALPFFPCDRALCTCLPALLCAALHGPASHRPALCAPCLAGA